VPGLPDIKHLRNGVGTLRIYWKRNIYQSLNSKAYILLKKNEKLESTERQLAYLETDYWEEAREVARQKYEKEINEEAGREKIEKCSCAVCGTVMKSRGFEKKLFVSQLGDIRYSRRYYVCPNGHGGYSLFDKKLGLYKQNSLGIQQWINFASAKDSFEEAAETIKVFSGINLVSKSAQEVSEHFGELIDKKQKEETKQIFNSQTRPKEPKGPDRMYIEVDGAHVPKREKEKWSECRVGVIFETPPEENRRPENVQYVAGIEHIDDFGERLFAQTYLRGCSTAKEVIFLGDGARVNWSLAEMHFPNAVHIVDFYHAIEHIYNARLLKWDEENKDGKTWAEEQKKRLKTGEWENFIKGFHVLPIKTENQRENKRKAINYFLNNKSRMKYHEYRSRGIYIGSGMAESGCKQVVKKRMRITGARWCDYGARAMIQIRCAYLNGEFRKLPLLQEIA